MDIRKLLFATGLVAAGLVHSHTGATGVVKERMHAMKDMGDMSKIVVGMFKGKTEFDREKIVQAADAFVLHGRSMSKLFPDTEQSRHGKKTEALSIIWEEWGDFETLINEFVSLSESLAESSVSTESEKELRKIFTKTTKSCSKCHKKFRKPKK